MDTEIELRPYFIDARVDIGPDYISVTVGPLGLLNWGRACPCSELADARYVRFDFARSNGDLVGLESDIPTYEDSADREDAALADAAKEYYWRFFR